LPTIYLEGNAFRDASMIDMDKRLVRTSKFLSLVLRHKPETIGLTIDEHGWADVDELIAAASRAGRALDRPLLLRVVEENDKQRFALSDDGQRIRASQGHSIDVDLELNAVEPPEMLYHGTVKRFLKSIREDGLRPRSRRYVHLSPDVDTATAVGKRRGKPVILRILAGAMGKDGYTFYCSANGVWLTDHVPVQYIRFPESQR